MANKKNIYEKQFQIFIKLFFGCLFWKMVMVCENDCVIRWKNNVKIALLIIYWVVLANQNESLHSFPMNYLFNRQVHTSHTHKFNDAILVNKTITMENTMTVWNEKLQMQIEALNSKAKSIRAQIVQLQEMCDDFWSGAITVEL